MVMQASDILAAHWDGELPVDVKKIAGDLGITLEPEPFLEFSGEISYRGGRPVIKYCAMDAPVRQRFTIAHEIGHFARGHLEQVGGRLLRDTTAEFSSSSASAIEREANSFAARLLMPAETLRFAVNVKRIRTIATLADTFGVSQVAMKYRLINLGMLNG